MSDHRCVGSCEADLPTRCTCGGGALVVRVQTCRDGEMQGRRVCEWRGQKRMERERMLDGVTVKP